MDKHSTPSKQQLEQQIARLVQSCGEEAKKWKFEKAMSQRAGRTCAPLVPNLDKMASRRRQCSDAVLSIPALPAAVVTVDLLEEEVRMNGYPRNDPQTVGRQMLEFYTMRRNWLKREHAICVDRWKEFTLRMVHDSVSEPGILSRVKLEVGSPAHCAVLETLADVDDAYKDANDRASRLMRGKVRAQKL
jgi:hypothetical protein